MGGMAETLELSATLSGPGREKSMKRESRGGQAASGDCSQKCRRTRHRNDRDASLNSQRHQAVSGIGYARHARIGHQRDSRSPRQLIGEFGCAFHLIMLLVAYGLL